MTNTECGATRGLAEGDYIEIPAWNTEGMVTAVRPDETGLGSDQSVLIMLQDRPEGREVLYRLEPDEYSIIA